MWILDNLNFSRYTMPLHVIVVIFRNKILTRSEI